MFGFICCWVERKSDESIMRSGPGTLSNKLIIAQYRLCAPKPKYAI